MSAGDWITVLAGILSPTKYLHNQTMAATRRDEKERAERNAEMALVAMEMAREGRCEAAASMFPSRSACSGVG